MDDSPTPPRKTPFAGGFFIMALTFGGAVYGAYQGQVMAYALGGLILGITIALVIYLVDRRR